MSANKQQSVACFACGERFKKHLSDIKVSKRHFCSCQCFNNVGRCGSRARKAEKFSACHPDRLHCAKGLCKLCYDRAYRKENPEIRRNAVRRYAKKHPDRLRASQLKCQYGITPEDVANRINEQEGLCAICGILPATDVDHNHTSGQFRGVLCGTCNRGIGSLKDSVTVVQKALEYLKFWEQREVN